QQHERARPSSRSGRPQELALRRQRRRRRRQRDLHFTSRELQAVRRRAVVVPTGHPLPPPRLAGASSARSRTDRVEQDPRARRREEAPRREPVPSAHARRARLKLRPRSARNRGRDSLDGYDRQDFRRKLRRPAPAPLETVAKAGPRGRFRSLALAKRCPIRRSGPRPYGYVDAKEIARREGVRENWWHSELVRRSRKKTRQRLLPV